MVWLHETKIRRKRKIILTDTDSFTVYMKTEDIYLYTWKDVEKRFDTSNYELERGKKKSYRLIKDQLGGKIRTEFATLIPKTYRYLTW